MAISDVLYDAVKAINEYGDWVPADGDEVTIVTIFMDALRCARDLSPRDAETYERLAAKIREAAPIAAALAEIQTTLYLDVARARASEPPDEAPR